MGLYSSRGRSSFAGVFYTIIWYNMYMAQEIQLYDPDDLTVVPWARQENEPLEWYGYFNDYYLALGPSRSLRKAFMTYLGINDPDSVEYYAERPNMNAAKEWTRMYSGWDWRIRAREFDRATMLESRAIVAEARKILFESAKSAADALKDALKDPRMRVAAAKEVLNRVGLPAVTHVDVNVRPYTADEYNKASEEVGEWEKKLLIPKTNGKNG